MIFKPGDDADFQADVCLNSNVSTTWGVLVATKPADASSQDSFERMTCYDLKMTEKYFVGKGNNEAPAS